MDTIVNNVYGTWRAEKDWKNPKHIKKGEGVYLIDKNDKKYIDFSSQAMCSNLGHGNQKVIDAIKKQAEEAAFIYTGFADDAKAKAAQSLLEILPEGLNHLFFSTSGTEANEAAVKISRMYFEDERKYKIISRYRSYHGSTSTSATLTGDPRRWWAESARTNIEGVKHAPDPYCYRCPFNQEYPDCGVQCAEYYDYMIEEEGNVASIIFEPIVGTNGIIVPPDEYYQRLREICDERDVLMIADEVMTGAYRTGTPFAMDHWDVRPDILTTAKGVTGAYTPLGVTATTEKIRDYFEENVFCHGHTYSGHSLVLSAVPPVIDEYERIFSSEKPDEVSEYLKESLYELGDKHPSIGDIRGKGHFWGLELVKNRKTKESFNVKSDKFRKKLMTDKVKKEAMKNGLYLSGWYSQLTIAPPLTITKEEVDKAIKILDKALKIADEETEETGIPVSKSSEGIIS